MIKESIQEEDVTIINIYTPNISAPQYVRQMLTSMKGEINKETQTLNDKMDQLDLIDIQNNEFHLFLKCTWNLLQDRSHPVP